MSYEFQSRIAGIPCIIRVNYSAGKAGNIWGPPENCYPSEPADVEFEICDRRGRHAPWLERKLNTKGWLRLESQVLDYIEKDSRDDY